MNDDRSLKVVVPVHLADRQMDGWMDEEMGQTNLVGWSNGQISRWIVGPTDTRTDQMMNGRVQVCFVRCRGVVQSRAGPGLTVSPPFAVAVDAVLYRKLNRIGSWKSSWTVAHW